MEWRPYVSVGARIAKGRRAAEKVAKKRGFPAQPVQDVGRKIAKSFWGEAWCENLEGYSDFENRLPRGKTLVRNGSIADLVIEKGKVKAIVGGSEVYKISIEFELLKKKKWDELKAKTAGGVDSVMSLLQGRLDESVMAHFSKQTGGLFPSPHEIDLDCDCPDWAGLCKHLAAVMYGIGARLDNEPELLFKLRGVDHLDLVTSQTGVDSLLNGGADSSLADQDLSQIFGIEFDDVGAEPVAKPPAAPARRKAWKKRAGKKAAQIKKVASKKSPKKKVSKKNEATLTPSSKKNTKKKATGKKIVKKKTSKKQTSQKPVLKKKVVRKKKVGARKAVRKK